MKKVHAKTEMSQITGTTVLLNGFKESKGYVAQLGYINKIEDGVYESIDDE